MLISTDEAKNPLSFGKGLFWDFLEALLAYIEGMGDHFCWSSGKNYQLIVTYSWHFLNVCSLLSRKIQKKHFEKRGAPISCFHWLQAFFRICVWPNTSTDSPRKRVETKRITGFLSAKAKLFLRLINQITATKFIFFTENSLWSIFSRRKSLHGGFMCVFKCVYVCVHAQMHVCVQPTTDWVKRFGIQHYTLLQKHYQLNWYINNSTQNKPNA